MSKKYFVHIVAMDENNAIGFEDKLLFPISDDLKRFKRLTRGHVVIAGTKTIKTLPLLLDRTVLHLTRDVDKYPHPDGHHVKKRIENIDEAKLGYAEPAHWAEPIFIIGGGEVYASTLDQASVIVMTRIHAKAEKADAWYPDFLELRRPPYCTESERHVDPKSGVEYSYVIYAYDREHLKHFLKYKAKRDKEHAEESKAKTVMASKSQFPPAW